MIAKDLPTRIALGLAIAGVLAALFIPRPGSVEPPEGYAAELASVTSRLEALKLRSARLGNDWTALEQLAEAHTERAALTGNYADFVLAEDLLAAAFSLATPGAGPFLTRAGLNVSLHRLELAEADLAAAEQKLLLSSAERATILGLRADVLAQRGDLQGALDLALEAAAVHPGPNQDARLGNIERSHGNFDAAEALFRKAGAGYQGSSARPRAWTHLQLGLMDLEAGRLDDAMAHYRDADRELPGWWLIEEHMAEILTLEGNLDHAIPRYEDLVLRTGNPEFMDALAAIWRSRGEHRLAADWASRAERIYASRLERFPEATYGHALGHYLEFGSDPAFTVELARRNASLRPNPEAMALLAEAEAQFAKAP